MIPRVVRAFLLALLSAVQVFATTYLLTDEIIGHNFYNAFVWEAIADPTNGRV